MMIRCRNERTAGDGDFRARAHKSTTAQRAQSRRCPAFLWRTSSQADPAYFLHLLRTGFPSVWAEVIDGGEGTVVCVPQVSVFPQVNVRHTLVE